ncbi:MAG: hypothetical protein V4577_07280 [Bacteroidota bacterium]
MNKYLIRLFLIIILFTSCRLSPFRNKILFKNSIADVEKSINEIIELLNKVKDPITINKDYDFREDTLFVNGVHVISTSIDTISALSKLSRRERLRFVDLSKVLKLNNITAASFDTYLNLWVFEYRFLAGEEGEDVRIIAVLNPADKQRIDSKVTVLDKKQEIYLLKYK